MASAPKGISLSLYQIDVMDLQSLYEKNDEELSKDRNSSYRGRARLPLNVLSFKEKQSRSDLDVNVKRLKKAFIKSRCERLEPSNVIPAIISQHSLDTIVKLSKITPELLLSTNDQPPLLKTPPIFSLQCLDGQSRVVAAKDVLPRNDAWWTVDLYLDEADEELRRALTEQYSNQANPCDGDIYIKIREYQCRAASLQDAAKARNHFAERRWWARLSANKQKDLKQLLRHESYVIAFDKFREFPALLAGLRISMIHDLMALKCEDEILQYLHHISDVMGNIVLAANASWMRMTDRNTLTRLQGRIPKFCEEDKTIIRSEMRDGDLFPAISDEQDRLKIQQNLLSIDCPIPTLDTLFENIKFLRPLSWAMKGLLDHRITASINESDKNRSVSRVFKEMFTDCDQDDDKVLIQVGKYSLLPYPGNKSDRIALGIWQLWLFAARNFTDLVSEYPLKEDNQPAPKPNKPNVSTWYDFASLACRLGFVSEKINVLRSRNPDSERARATLLEARDPSEFEYDPVLLKQYQDDISVMFTTAKLREAAPSSQGFRTIQSGESRKRRSGRPFENAYHDYRKTLFPPVFWSPIETVGEGVNALFVRVSVCNAFFGKHFSRIAVRSPTGGLHSTSNLDHNFDPIGVFTSRHPVTASIRTQDEANSARQLSDHVEILQRDLDAANKDLEDIRSRNSDLQTQVEELQVVFYTGDKDKEDTRSKYLELQAQFEKINDEKKVSAQNSEKQIASLQSELIDANSHNAQLQTQLGQLEDQVKLITVNLAESRNASSGTKKLSEEYETTIINLQAKQKLLNQNLEAKDKIIIRLRKDQATQENSKKGKEAELAAQLKKQTKDREDFETELMRQLEEKRRLEQEIQELRSEVDQYSKIANTPLQDQSTQTIVSSKDLEKEKNSFKELEQAKAEIAHLREELREIPRLDLQTRNHFTFTVGEQVPPDLMEFGERREPLDTSPRSKVTWYHGDDSQRPDVQYMTPEEVTRLAKKYLRNKKSLRDRQSNRSLDVDLISEDIKRGQELEIVVIAMDDSPRDATISSSRNRPIKTIRMGHTGVSPPRGLFTNMLPVVTRANVEEDIQLSKKKKTLQKKGGES